MLAPFNHPRLADWHGWLPTALEVACVLLLAIQAARMVWVFATPAGPIGTFAAVPDATAVQLPSLPTSDLFFRQPETASNTGEALGYTLFGVRAGDDVGSAILSGKDGSQASWPVGAEIAPGIALVEVGADHAVLTSSGARHRIQLPRSPESTVTAAGSPRTLPTGLPPAAAIDPGQLLSQTRLQASPNGGFVLQPGSGDAQLHQAGLQPGDVLLSVNGQPLTPERLGALKDELKGRSQATIQYRRDGQTLTTSVPVQP